MTLIIKHNLFISGQERDLKTTKIYKENIEEYRRSECVQFLMNMPHNTVNDNEISFVLKLCFTYL